MNRNPRTLLLTGAVAIVFSAVALAQPGGPPPGGPGFAMPAAPPVLPKPIVFDPSKKNGPQGDSWDSIKQLPDWSGDWTLDDASFARVRDTTDSPNANNPNVPKLTRKYWDYRMLNKVQNKGTQGTGANNNAAKCIPDGMPGVMSIPMGHEFLFTPGRVTSIAEDGEVRRIWTDGRSHPADPDLKFSGDEVGYWDHGALVVETRYILPKAELFVGMPGETGTVVLERIFLKSAKTLEIDTIVSNPKVFKEPFHYVRTFDRQAQLEEALCDENNRDNNGEVDLTPPPLEGPPGGAPPVGAAHDAPVIGAIQFTGNTEVSSADLMKVMQLKVGDAISREKMHADLESIVSLYRKKGHNLSVSPDISHPAAGRVVINIRIDEKGTAGDAGAAPAGVPR